MLLGAIFGILYINYHCQATAGLHSIEAAEESAGLPFLEGVLFLCIGESALGGVKE
ncbi:hypothetical protein SBF1_560037 [Candidatus Desulfosporosinus infrequens]|uniref:Uncharacterized protein n=1 Tax=Candidatus Desulfosporosinus infrequens TaxID=2043169 RepID=A0A2U3LJV6_9FIRM|nr:hypothetical protein SBF1_560037 [Candidatus Desulfosporosinus infrequens]